jgi:hypothetical protein
MVTELGLPSERYVQLARASGAELRRLMLEGETPSIKGMASHRHWYQGYNQLALLALVGSRTFIKRFAYDSVGRAEGWNVPVRQNGLAGPWAPKPSERRHRRYGFFRVSEVDPASRDAAYPNAVLLDYRAGRRSRFSPTQLLRDYVVRVQHGSDNLLLGRAYLAVLRWRVPVCFFVIERRRRPADG